MLVSGFEADSILRLMSNPSNNKKLPGVALCHVYDFLGPSTFPVNEVRSLSDYEKRLQIILKLFNAECRFDINDSSEELRLLKEACGKVEVDSKEITKDIFTSLVNEQFLSKKGFFYQKLDNAFDPRSDKYNFYGKFNDNVSATLFQIAKRSIAQTTVENNEKGTFVSAINTALHKLVEFRGRISDYKGSPLESFLDEIK